MSVDLAATNITLATVILAAIAFFVGLTIVVVYIRVVALFRKNKYEADETVIESVVLEYTRRLRDYDKVIAELRTKVDVLELRQDPEIDVTSQPHHTSRAPQHHAPHITQPADVTQHATIADMDMVEGQNGTMDYILKMLLERPRTTREVHAAVGRSREHTARLMKKLHESGLVARDVKIKPFKYTITDSGREMLERGQVEGASEVRVHS